MKAWILAIRPATLMAAVGPVAVGTALAPADGAAHAPAAVAALAGALLIQVGTNLVNDLADFRRGADDDDRLGPARAVQKGWLGQRAVAWGAALSFLAAVGVGTYLVSRGVTAGSAYTAGPFPLGYHGLGDVFVLAFFGLAAVCGTYYVQALTVTPATVAAALAVGAPTTAILVVNNLRDRNTDARAGKRTLAVRFGATFARLEYAGLLAMAYIVAAAQGWWVPFASLPFALVQVRALRTADGVALNPHLGRTAGLGLLFSLLLALEVAL